MRVCLKSPWATGYVMVNCTIVTTSFDALLACDRQTDRQTDCRSYVATVAQLSVMKICLVFILHVSQSVGYMSLHTSVYLMIDLL